MGKEMTYHKDCDRSDINIKHFYLKSLEYAALYTKLLKDLVHPLASKQRCSASPIIVWQHGNCLQIHKSLKLL